MGNPLDFGIDGQAEINQDAKELDKAEDVKRIKIEVEKTGEKCDKCGEGEMVIRTGKFGKFIACSNYPKCRNTKKIEQTEKSETDKN